MGKKTKKVISKKNSISKSKIDNFQKPHKWRLCPYGEHWVTSHPLHIPPSEKEPTGSITTRRGHCARNPSGKDQLYPDEIKTISEKYFKNLKK
jgi:hypothetical protein